MLAKAASGALEYVPIVTVQNLARALATLRERGYFLVGLDSTGDADLGDATLRAPLAQADQFGVIEAAADGQRIAAFREKPTDATGLPDAPDQVYASMGNYVFTADVLVEALASGTPVVATDHGSPGMLNSTEVMAPPNSAPQ